MAALPPPPCRGRYLQPGGAGSAVALMGTPPHEKKRALGRFFYGRVEGALLAFRAQRLQVQQLDRAALRLQHPTGFEVAQDLVGGLA